MPDITTDGLKQFVAAAKPLHLENGWAGFDLEVAREACLQWTPLETCEAKKQILKKFSSLLTVARFALQGSIDLERYELPVPKAPPADFHPCQDICTVKDLEQRLREHYSYAGSLAPAEELFKYMAKSIDILDQPVFESNVEFHNLARHAQTILKEAYYVCKGRKWFGIVALVRSKIQDRNSKIRGYNWSLRHGKLWSKGCVF